MKYKSKMLVLALSALLASGLFLQAYAGVSDDVRLFQEAKILIFDKKWDQAQEKLDRILNSYPESPLYAQALFYKATCLKEQEGKEEEALETYRSYLVRKDKTAGLSEESESAIIELSFRLYEKTGKKSFLKEIERRLYRENRTVRYYAASMLSKVKDKKYAEIAVPVLKEIIATESDEDLRDRARIYLLRISPKAYREMEREPSAKRPRMLNIRVQNRWKNIPEFSFSIPWSLADLALSAVPAKAREELAQEGYNLDKIIREITQYKGRVLEIKTKNSVIKIWIN